MGERALGQFSTAGWTAYQPSYPLSFEDIRPYCYDAAARVAWMDEHGIDKQILYPNVVAFEGHAILALDDPALRLEIVRAYNDYVDDFEASAPGRFIKLAALPYWDRDAAIVEMERCAVAGHKGIVWAATLEKHGMPHQLDPYWDPLYERAQAMQQSVNFHIGVGASDMTEQVFRRRFAFDAAPATKGGALNFMANATTICELLTSGICERFPKLDFVSVESGFGYVPYLLEALDWQWRNYGGPTQYPNRLLPSEYFTRQVSTMYWFEERSLDLVRYFPDNVMFETDFPHPTSLSPGDGSPAESPAALTARAAARLGSDLARKVFHDNAARVYHLER